jgi:hypothetical protein
MAVREETPAEYKARLEKFQEEHKPVEKPKNNGPVSIDQLLSKLLNSMNIQDKYSASLPKLYVTIEAAKENGYILRASYDLSNFLGAVNGISSTLDGRVKEGSMLKARDRYEFAGQRGYVVALADNELKIEQVYTGMPDAAAIIGMLNFVRNNVNKIFRVKYDQALMDRIKRGVKPRETPEVALYDSLEHAVEKYELVPGDIKAGQTFAVSAPSVGLEISILNKGKIYVSSVVVDLREHTILASNAQATIKKYKDQEILIDKGNLGYQIKGSESFIRLDNGKLRFTKYYNKKPQGKHLVRLIIDYVENVAPAFVRPS